MPRALTVAILAALALAACAASAEVEDLEARIAQLEQAQADISEQTRNLEVRANVAHREREILFESDFRQNRAIEGMDPNYLGGYQGQIDQLEERVDLLCRHLMVYCDWFE